MVRPKSPGFGVLAPVEFKGNLALALAAPALVCVPLRLQPLLVVFRDVFDLRTLNL